MNQQSGSLVRSGKVMQLVPCDETYWEFVRQLRTDPRTSYGFIEQVEITPEQQRAYMAEHSHEYFVCLLDGKPAGFTGSVGGDVRVCTHPDFQKQGVGAFMVREISQRFPDGVAKVKVGNAASNALFRSNGYVPIFTVYKRRDP